MRKVLFIIGFLLSNGYANAQLNEDSLYAIINQHKGDTAEVNALVYLGALQQQIDSLQEYAMQGMSLAKKIEYKKGEADCLMLFQDIYARQGNFSQTIQTNLDALAIYQDLKDFTGITSAQAQLQGTYREVGDYRKALSHGFSGLQTAEAHNVHGSFFFRGHRWAPLLLAEIGQTYLLMNQLDSALFYTKQSIAQKELFNGTPWEFPLYLLATILTMKGEYKLALEKYREALELCLPNDFLRDTLQIYSGMSTLFINTRQYDSAIHYASIVTKDWNSQSEYKNLLEAVRNLAQAYKATGSKDSALKYLEVSQIIKDSVFSAEKDRSVQQVAFDAKLNEEAFKADRIRYKSRVQLFVLVSGVFVLLLISVILWRNNQHKQKAKAKIEKAYETLKATQAQLIQQEKMASLGELTAGIAHEIQNPLNFVNNFSEVNCELLDELEQANARGRPEEVQAIARELKQNEEKIAYHGKRADSIVKSMLQHSRASTGEKQPTDINALADEYLRLSYQAMRSKDKSFQAAIETRFDNDLPKIDLIPQDIGRVLLNLFQNAFYAVNEKRKTRDGTFAPVVSVSTNERNGKAEICVKDNGTGIPPKVQDKIFQPFFTSKPTGEGTGLGLYLSYDIITKGHGGTLSVQSSEGEGAEFVIQLPVQSSEVFSPLNSR